MADPVDLGGGWWLLRVFVNRDAQGNKVRYRTQRRFEADGIRRARAKARQVEVEVVAEFFAAQDAAAHRTVAQAAESWWELWVRRSRSPTTRQGYRKILDTYILGAPFAGVRVEDVTTGQVERWYSSLASEPRGARPPVSPSTVRRIHAVLTQVFDQCVRDGLLARNPAEKAHKPASLARKKPDTPVGVVMAVLAAAHRRSAVRARLIAFAALTGLRRGELCGIRHSNLDLDRGILMVEFNEVTAQERFIDLSSTSRKSRVHQKDPKAHQVMGIALGDQATELARQQIEWQGPAAEDAYLWAVEDPFTTPLHPDTLTKWFTQARKDAGVTGVSLHSMRHWQASQVLAVGGTVADVQERLRHQSMATSMGYIHADQTRQRVLVDLLPRLELPVVSSD